MTKVLEGFSERRDEVLQLEVRRKPVHLHDGRYFIFYTFAQVCKQKPNDEGVDAEEAAMREKEG